MHNSYISSLYSQEITENSKLWVEKNPKEDSIRIRYNCLWKGCQSYCDNINILDEHINKHIEDEPQFISGKKLHIYLFLYFQVKIKLF